MYKDAWDIREGSDDASFTVNTVNGIPATKGETLNLAESKTIDGDIRATLTETSLHAGVYPSAIKEIVFEDVDKTTYAKAQKAIDAEAKTNKMSYSVVNVKAKTTDDALVKIISETEISVSTEKYQGVKFYKIVGSDIDEITAKEAEGFATVTVNSSDVNLVVMTKGGSTAKKGCGSVAVSSLLAIIPALAVVAFVKKRK